MWMALPSSKTCSTAPCARNSCSPALGLDDTVLELAITANRPDGLSMTGIAREVYGFDRSSVAAACAHPPAVTAELATDSAIADRMKSGGLYGITGNQGRR